MHLLRTALDRDLPVFGICRGIQVMAVATGGDIWQDIPSQCPGSLAHRQSAPRQDPSHDVMVTADSLLARILWPEGNPQERISVNSFHHQAPRKCGTLFQAVAMSPDGITEALSIPAAHFALGVQWHPEELAGSDPSHARLFTAFVKAAQGRPIGRGCA